MTARKITIYTDGGCSPNPGVGGWGVVLMCGDHKKELSGGSKQSTNNEMELTAAIKALEALKTTKLPIDLYTDSKYVKDGITKWVNGWKARKWKTSTNQPVKNEKLWKRLDKLNRRFNIEWHWVKGHSNDKYNDRVDFLATKEINKARRS